MASFFHSYVRRRRSSEGPRGCTI